jgi:O-succinylbenzoate synthase
MICPVSIKIRKVSSPLIKPFIISTGRIDTRDVIIIEMRDKDGVVGYGEAPTLNSPMYKADYPSTVIAVINDIIGPTLFNKTFATPADLDKTLDFIRGHNFAKAAISMAAYDIYGKKMGKTVHELLGGTDKDVEYSLTVSVYNDPKQTLDEAREYIDKYDIGLIKLKVKPGSDIKNIEILKENFPERKIMIDANASYTLDESSLKFFKAIDAMGLLCIEQPLTHDDIVFHARLQSEMKTPLSLDESIDTVSHLNQACEIKAARAVNLKIPRVGGLTTSLEIHDICVKNGLFLWVGGMIESPISTMFNLAFATKSGCIWPADFMETFTLLKSSDELIVERPFTVQGCKITPNFTRPGLGIEINEPVLDRYSVSVVEAN